MKIHTTPYLDQQPLWPQSGRAIMAQFDDTSIVVYQAYRPAIGHFAAQNGYFGGPFKMTRMTWIKPNFLWMMYRSGWGTKEGQEVTLAIRLKRTAFDHILANAVHSAFVPDLYPTREAWKEAVATSDVRLQWDPDHDPSGAKVERRAIQLGLRGQTVAQYARDWIVDIQDISSFVAQQRRQAQTGHYRDLWTPAEEPYPVIDPEVAKRLGL